MKEKLSIPEQNRLANIYRREAQQHNIGSPFRQKLYIDARIKGCTPEAALAKARVKPK